MLGKLIGLQKVRSILAPWNSPRLMKWNTNIISHAQKGSGMKSVQPTDSMDTEIRRPVVQTSESSLSSSTARCTMGPRTAYSTFFTVGFMVSMVNTLARAGTPFSVIFSLGSPRRAALRLDKALPGEDRGGEVSERTPGPSPGPCAPPQPANNSFRPRLKSRTFLGDSSCIRAADMVHLLSASRITSKASALQRETGCFTRERWNESCVREGTTLLKILLGPLNRSDGRANGASTKLWSNPGVILQDLVAFTYSKLFTLTFRGFYSMNIWQQCNYPTPLCGFMSTVIPPLRPRYPTHREARFFGYWAADVAQKGQNLRTGCSV